MANHKSAIKRMRANQVKRDRNRYQAKTARNAIKTLRLTEKKKEVTDSSPKIISMIDKLAKKGIIHKNKAANLKSKLAKKANTLNSK